MMILGAPEGVATCIRGLVAGVREGVGELTTIGATATSISAAGSYRYAIFVFLYWFLQKHPGAAISNGYPKMASIYNPLD